MKKEYAIQSSLTPKQLAEMVNIALQNGWKLQGGVCTSLHYGIMEFHQALYKNEQPKTNNDKA
jgi:hypothetical protein